MADQQQHVFITGGGSGIGLACAQHFLELGAAVTLFGRSRDRLAAAQGALAGAGTVHVVAGDASTEADVAAAIATANDAAPLTGVIANAGVGGASPLLETAASDWQHIMNVNLNGTFHSFKHGGQALARNGGGTLCAVSSIAGLKSHRFMAAYCASKAAIDMLVRTAADELGGVGIRVNSVCPGLVETEISAGLHENDGMRADYLECMPLQMIGQPEDIAAAIGFLASDAARWITGVSLPVDGGHHLRRGPDLTAMTPGG